MANRFKVLGQLTGTGSDVALYTVPSPASSTPAPGRPKASIAPVQTLVTSLIVCNTNTSEYKFTVRLKEDKDSGDDPKEFLFYQTVVGGFSSLTISMGLTLPGEAQIKVKVDTATPANVSFTLMGIEVF